MSHGTVREQAQRIVDAIEYDMPDTGPEWRIRDDGPTIGLAEQYAVAGEYLAEHSADDDVPVTASWLGGIGFVPSAQMANVVRLPADDDLFIEIRDGSFIPMFEQGLRGWIIMAEVVTRSDVRRLMKSLGMEQKSTSLRV